MHRRAPRSLRIPQSIQPAQPPSSPRRRTALNDPAPTTPRCPPACARRCCHVKTIRSHDLAVAGRPRERVGSEQRPRGHQPAIAEPSPTPGHHPLPSVQKEPSGSAAPTRPLGTIGRCVMRPVGRARFVCGSGRLRLPARRARGLSEATVALAGAEAGLTTFERRGDEGGGYVAFSRSRTRRRPRLTCSKVPHCSSPFRNCSLIPPEVACSRASCSKRSPLRVASASPANIDAT
jgi:hypothetical protein